MGRNDNIKAKVNILGKIVCTFMTIASFGGLFVFSVFFFMFFIDQHPFENLPSLYKNSKFLVCELHYTLENFCAVSETLTKLLWNFSLLAIFWFQHIIMAKQWFKRATMAIFPEYLFIERPIFNLASEYMGIVMLQYYQPLNMRGTDFNVGLFMAIPFTFFQLMGAFLILKSLYDMRREGDLMGVEFMLKLWNTQKEYMTFNERYEVKGKISVKNLYSVCRHPLQAGIMLIMVFSGLRFTFDKIFIIGIMVVGIVYGTKREERILSKTNPEYIQYKKVVRNRFIPNFVQYNKVSLEKQEQ